ncbi:hypothetical protein [Streptomyces sp. NPDC056525]
MDGADRADRAVERSELIVRTELIEWIEPIVRTELIEWIELIGRSS